MWTADVASASAVADASEAAALLEGVCAATAAPVATVGLPPPPRAAPLELTLPLNLTPTLTPTPTPTPTLTLTLTLPPNPNPNPNQARRAARVSLVELPA